MRLGLTIDSACDLPSSFIERHKIVVIPIKIETGKQILLDTRDEAATQAFYRSGILKQNAGVRSTALTEDEITQLFKEQVVQQFDFNLVQTITQSRSLIFANASQAAHRILSEYRSIRDAQHKKPFSVRVVDTHNMFAGQAVIAAETVRLALSNLSRSDLRRRVELLASQAYCYAVLPDLAYARERGKLRGDKSISFLGALIGKALSISPILCVHQGKTFPVAKTRGYEQSIEYLLRYVEQRIYKGLISPYIVMSYAGDIHDLNYLPGIERLERLAQANNLRILRTVMSMTAGANLGAGAFGIAFCDSPHQFSDFADN